MSGTKTEDESRVLAAILAEKWFTLQTLYLSTPSTAELSQWRLDCIARWNGFRNISRSIAEGIENWPEGDALDSGPLWIIAGTRLPIGVAPEIWEVAYVVCSKLRARLGSAEQLAALAAGKRADEKALDGAAAGGSVQTDEAVQTRDPKLVKKLRSWTQTALDAAVEQYVAKRSSSLPDLIWGVKHKKRGAVKDARKMFGRSAIGKALEVKRGSYSMITNCPAWQGIAEDLGLHQSTGPKRKNIGIDMAVEEAAEAAGDLVEDDVIARELKGKIEESGIPEDFADALYNKFILREMTFDQAIESLETTVESLI